jgi:intracellular multiplication protein IcmL
MTENSQDGKAPKAAPAQPAIHPLLAALFGKKQKPAAAAPPESASANTAQPSAPSSTAAVVAAAAATKTTALPPGPLVAVLTRNEFYRDGFRNLIRIAILESIIIVGLILTLIIYINTSKPQDRYFATTADGRIMQLVPLDRPNMTSAALMSWVAQATTEVMTFGFHDYQRRFQQASRHFTKTGWESFTLAMQRARIIDSVQALQQVVTAAPRSAPVLVQQGILNGKYRWVLQMNLQVTYKSAGAGGASRTDNLKLNLVVERVPSLENPNGVGISQWVATQG